MLTLVLDNIIAFQLLDYDGLFPLALVFIAVFFLLSSLWRRQRKRNRELERDSQIRKAAAPVSAESNITRDLEDLLVELQELSRRISADIDTKFAKLEAAIRDADRRIAVLNRLDRHMVDETSVNSQEAGDHEARHAVIYELADAGFTPVQIAKDLGKSPGEVELILNLRKQADS
ncbi:MAG: hypothetical protein JSV03_09510 [Planctomycetota bacterium]|nr:MAG: hypothetical protein JSV03_09510 [Planctomycetota bacterium]